MAVKLLVAGVEVLLRVEEVAHTEDERKAVAKAFLELCIDHVCRPDFGITHADSVVVVPRKVDVELCRQGEGRRCVGHQHMVQANRGIDCHTLFPRDIGQVGVGLPPLRELQRGVQIDIILLRVLVVDVVDIDDVRVIRVGHEVLLNLIRLERYTGREGIFVPRHIRQVDAVRKRGVEQRVTRLIGVVRNLLSLGVELPERGARNLAGILTDEHMLALLVEFVRQVQVREEREVILAELRAVALGAGVFATQTRHKTPAVEITTHNAIGGRNLLVVVDQEALALVFKPYVLLLILEQGIRLHAVVGVFSAGLEDDFGREVLLVAKRGGCHAVLRVGEVAVERVNRVHRTTVVVAVFVLAYLIVGQEFQRRAEGVDLPYIIKGGVDVALLIVAEEEAPGLLLERLATQERVGVVGAVFFGLGEATTQTDRVLFRKLIDGIEATAIVLTRFVEVRLRFELCRVGEVGGLLCSVGLGGLVGKPGGCIEVQFSAMQGDVGRGVEGESVAVCGSPHLHRTHRAVLALTAQRDLDDATCRIGIVVGSRGGDDLDFLNLLRA